MKYAGLGAPEPLIIACVAIVVVALLLVVRSITKKREVSTQEGRNLPFSPKKVARPVIIRAGHLDKPS